MSDAIEATVSLLVLVVRSSIAVADCPGYLAGGSTKKSHKYPLSGCVGAEVVECKSKVIGGASVTRTCIEEKNTSASSIGSSSSTESRIEKYRASVERAVGDMDCSGRPNVYVLVNCSG